LALYAQVVTTITSNPKIRKAARLAGVDRATIIGAYVSLLVLAVDHAEDGDLGDYDPEDLQAEISSGRAAEIMRAMIDAGLLSVGQSGGLSIVGWGEHTGKGLDKRAKWREQKRAQRADKRADNSRTVRADKTDMSTPDNDGDRDRDIDTDKDPRRGASGGAGGEQIAEPVGGQAKPAPQTPKPKPPKVSFEDLLGQEWEGFPTVRAYLEHTFPAFDGENGRAKVEDVIEDAREWCARHPKRRWKTPRGIVSWFRRDYQRVRVSYEQDLRFGRVHENKPERVRQMPEHVRKFLREEAEADAARVSKFQLFGGDQ
jgi:hypothetical protein